MHKLPERSYGRTFNQLRPVLCAYDVFGYATASVLLSMGNTKVLCAVSLQTHVPPFLKGTKTGWLKAEYAMLPTATDNRTQRESSSGERNGRSVEISRLIGRSLRTMVNLAALGERTIIIDCDVLQADGGTRAACITASSQALRIAAERWVKAGILTQNIITGSLAAVSVGVRGDHALLDIDYAEDSTLDADFNFVLTRSGSIVEIQGTAEKQAISWDQFGQLQELARAGIQDLFAAMDSSAGAAVDKAAMRVPAAQSSSAQAQKKRDPFSIGSRLQTQTPARPEPVEGC